MIDNNNYNDEAYEITYTVCQVEIQNMKYIRCFTFMNGGHNFDTCCTPDPHGQVGVRSMVRGLVLYTTQPRQRKKILHTHNLLECITA